MKFAFARQFPLSIFLFVSSLYAQQKDVMGYYIFDWGQSIHWVRGNFEVQKIEYTLSNSPNVPHKKFLVAESQHLLEDENTPSLPIDKRFVFYKDSLIEVILSQKYDSKKLHDQAYGSSKYYLSRIYENTPQDMYTNKGTVNEIRSCFWKFKTTTITLFQNQDGVTINYTPQRLLERIDQEIEQRVAFVRDVDSPELLEKEIDAFGYTNYPWGISFNKVLRNLTSQDFRYVLSIDSINRDSKNIAAGYQVFFEPYDLTVGKIYLFPRDTLTAITLMVTTSNEKERKERYAWVKQILSEKYKHTPDDQSAIDSKGQDATICQWTLPKTTVSLTNGDGFVLIMYYPAGMQDFDRNLRKRE